MYTFLLNLCHFTDPKEINSGLCVSDTEGVLRRFTMFNGGLSKEQLDWLDSVLSSADEKQEKVTVVSK